MAKKEKSFEQNLERLRVVTQLLSDSGTELSKALELYKEGVELSILCNKKLTEAECEIEVLSKTLDNSFSKASLELEGDI